MPNRRVTLGAALPASACSLPGALWGFRGARSCLQAASASCCATSTTGNSRSSILAGGVISSMSSYGCSQPLSRAPSAHSRPSSSRNGFERISRSESVSESLKPCASCSMLSRAARRSRPYQRLVLSSCARPAAPGARARARCGRGTRSNLRRAHLLQGAPEARRAQNEALARHVRPVPRRLRLAPAPGPCCAAPWAPAGPAGRSRGQILANRAKSWMRRRARAPSEAPSGAPPAL